MKNKPNVYSFDSISNVELGKIEGNAILFIGKSRKKKIYFVKENQFVTEGNSCKSKNIKITKEQQEIIQKNHNTDGKIILNNEQWELNTLISHIVIEAKFPYAHTPIYLSKDARSIRINFALLGHKKHEIHPILQNYDPDEDDLLTFLRKVKAAPDIEQSVSFYQDGGIPIGFSRTKGRAHEIGINRMLYLVLQAKDTFYSTVFKKINDIGSRFKSSPLTVQKQQILNDFKLYCGMHAGIKSRKELVQDWCHDYENKYNQDPFVILSQHRSNMPSLFTPKKTDSIKLFEDFIGKENRLDDIRLGPCNDEGLGW